MKMFRLPNPGTRPQSLLIEGTVLVEKVVPYEDETPEVRNLFKVLDPGKRDYLVKSPGSWPFYVHMEDGSVHVEYRTEQGHLHRERKPAILFQDGTVEYWRRNERHNTQGPAISRGAEFFLFGVGVTWKLVQARQAAMVPMPLSGQFVWGEEDTVCIETYSLGLIWSVEWFDSKTGEWLFKRYGPERNNLMQDCRIIPEGKTHANLSIFDGPHGHAALIYKDKNGQCFHEHYQEGYREGFSNLYGKAVYYHANNRVLKKDVPVKTVRDADTSWTGENGDFHRISGPASIRARDGFYQESWYAQGLLHREGGPARITISERCSAGTSYEWFQHGKPHRVGGPSLIRMCDFPEEEWCQFGRFHREDGPASTSYEDILFKNGMKGCKRQQWIEHGQLIRDQTFYPESEVLFRERFFNEADDTPALIYYKEDGSTIWQGWCKDGKLVRSYVLVEEGFRAISGIFATEVQKILEEVEGGSKSPRSSQEP